MLTAWFVISWFLLRGADATRPSALHRIYALIWMYVGAFIILVGVTIAEQKYGIAGGYFMVIYYATVSLALLISYLEMFRLPRKSVYVASLGPGSPPATSRSQTSGIDASGDSHDTNAVDDANETTSLLRGDRQSFARYGDRRESITESQYTGETALGNIRRKPYKQEQAWSASLPQSLWLLQFLILSFNIIFVGQVSLLLTSALHQTPADGSPALTVYLFFAVMTVLMLAPLGPFIHRFTYHIPTLFFLILVGTMIYNLVAFPFSSNNRLKVFFLQQVDCNTGRNTVSLTGLQPYVTDIISQLPSAAGKVINCTEPDYKARSGLAKCSWEGVLPNPVPHARENGTFTVYKKKSVPQSVWFEYNVTRSNKEDSALFHIKGRNTRACRLFFNSRISDFNVEGASNDPRFTRVDEKGATEIRLWHREWDIPWEVTVYWNGTDKEDGASRSGLSGRVACLWSDQNESGVIPALEEVRHFMPVWSQVTKLGDGLVEGSKGFQI
jgi:hypothetical protein